MIQNYETLVFSYPRDKVFVFCCSFENNRQI